MTRVSAEAVTASIALGGRASAVVVGPDGEHIYVAQSDSVAVISSCHHIVARIPLDDEPKDLALDAAGRRLFAITYDGSVSVINTCDYTMKTIPCHWGSDVAVSPDGRYQYVARTDNHQILGHSVISAIDAGGRTIATMSVVSLVTGLTVSPDGTRLCAISSDRGSYYQYPPGWLTIIDTARHAVLSTLAIGSIRRRSEAITSSRLGLWRVGLRLPLAAITRRTGPVSAGKQVVRQISLPVIRHRRRA
jgi:DNA-binding beta-propeller fold protein YncE